MFVEFASEVTVEELSKVGEAVVEDGDTNPFEFVVLGLQVFNDFPCIRSQPLSSNKYGKSC